MATSEWLGPEIIKQNMFFYAKCSKTPAQIYFSITPKTVKLRLENRVKKKNL
jgi:hypothetical protein